MHRLYLLRHAKSAWDDPALDDHDRPLTPRGERAAVTMGQHMQQQGLRPDLVLCSSARRARDTWMLIESRLSGTPTVLVEPGLYLAGVLALLERLKSLDEGVGAALLIVHIVAELVIEARKAFGGRPERAAATAHHPEM